MKYASKLWSSIKPLVARKSTYSTDITDKKEFGAAVKTLSGDMQRAQRECTSAARKVSSSTTSAVKRGFMTLLKTGGANEWALDTIEGSLREARHVQTRLGSAWPAIDKVLARVEHKLQKRKDFNGATTVQVVSQVGTLPSATMSVLAIQKMPAFTITEIHPALRTPNPWDSDAEFTETHPALRTSEPKEPEAVITETQPTPGASAPRES